MNKTSAETNILKEKHSFLLQLPKMFRENVCEECGWSEATFYRKAKGKNTFSNAEKDKIIAVCNGLLAEQLPSIENTINKS